MKNKFKLVGSIICLVIGICFWSNQKNDQPVLLLENIEALAYGEHGDRVNCYSDGSVECLGEWVEMRISGFSLE